MIMIAEQIDLFDLLRYVELPWKECTYDRGRLCCEVQAIIPKRVLSPTERWNIRCSEEESKAARDEWGKYAMAIWQYQWRFNRDWMYSIRLLSEHRDRGEPIWMVLNKGQFIPEQIIKVIS